MNAEYFVSKSGKIPVKQFVDSLDHKTQRKFFAKVELLEKFGRNLPAPHAKFLRQNIYELRFSGADGAVRILFFFFLKDKAILTNGFKKNMQKTPEREIKKAIDRRDIYLNK